MRNNRIEGRRAGLTLQSASRAVVERTESRLLLSGTTAGATSWPIAGVPADQTLAVNVASLGTAAAFDLSQRFSVVQSNGIGYFAADGGATDALWRTDGTAGGTYQIGPGGVDPSDLTNVNGTLYFSAFGLWKSDGTQGGTVQIRPAGAVIPHPDALVDFNGTLYFMEHTPSGGRGLWKSDGTSAGTVLIKDFGAGNAEDNHLVVHDGRIYVTAPAGGSSPAATGLWVSDGTAAGTTLLDPSLGATVAGSFKFFDAGAALYFTAYDQSHDTPGLWKTDGTAAGTVELADASKANFSLNDLGMATSGSNAYFLAPSGSGNTIHLWRTDGTPSGTQAVADSGSPYSATDAVMQHRIIAVGGKLVFATSADGRRQTTVWTSDGTAAGTVPLLTTTSDTLDSQRVGVYGLSALNDVGYFTAEEGTKGWEVWRTDGTTTGTLPITAFPADSDPPAGFATLGDHVTFAATDPVHGRQLWETDGTSAGTQPLTSISHPIQQAIPNFADAAGGGAFYFVPSRGGGQDLWKTDGTPAGTVRLWHGSEGLEALAAGSTLFFGEAGSDALWESDGTVAGTVPVAGPPPISNPLAALGSVMYLDAYNPDTGRGELWKIDGSGATAEFVSTVQPSNSVPGSAVASGGFLYFIGQSDAAGGWEVFRTDGTAAGTIQLTSLGDSPDGPVPSQLTDVNGTVFFVAQLGSQRPRLWKTDGTPAGTVAVSAPLIAIDQITTINGTAFFAATDDAHGDELWKSDGTAAGTMLVKDIVPGMSGSRPRWIVDVNGAAVFATTNSGGSINGVWRSDGTPAGTIMIQQSLGGYPPPFQMVSNGSAAFYFNGGKLWITDGTVQGTHVVDADLGAASADVNLWGSVRGLIAGNRFYYAGGTGTAASPVSVRVATVEPLSAPTQLAETSTPASGATPASVTLSWTSNSPVAAGFVIERSTHADYSTDDGDYFAPSGSNTFTDSSPTAGPVLYYRVRAVDAAGESSPSTVVSASFGTIRGIVFQDLNYNGTYDTGALSDTPQPNVTVFIDSNGNGKLDPGEMSTTSNLDGTYQFGGLAAGSYTIRALPIRNGGYVWSTPLGGGETVTAVPGQLTTVPNFGLVLPSWVKMDFNYLMLLASHFGSAGTIASGDLNNDGRVDFNDLVILAANYGHSLVTSAAAISGPARPAKRPR